MSDSILTVILSASVASLTTLIGFFVNSWLTHRRERRQNFERQESERALVLEERAGMMVELVRTLPRGTEPDTSLMELAKQLGLDAGRFGRYRALSSAILSLQNCALWVVRQKLTCDDTRTAEKELHDAYSSFLRLIKELR